MAAIDQDGQYLTNVMGFHTPTLLFFSRASTEKIEHAVTLSHCIEEETPLASDDD